MVEFAGDVDKTLKILKDGEIRLVLEFGLTKSLQFYYLICDNFNNVLGHCCIRLSNEEKNKYIGNIEYEIYEKYRGNNYALKATKLLCNVAKYYNVDKINITTTHENLASIKTLEKLGARFIEIRKVPKNMRLHKISKEIRVYELDIERRNKI